MKKIVFFLSLFLMFNSCKKEDETNIPDARVYINITLNNYSVFKSGVGEYLVCPADLLAKDKTGSAFGYGGIILYHTVDTDQPFAAFDRACTYEAKSSVKVNVNGSQAVCPQCGSVFDLLSGYGAKVSGPAKYPLRNYKVHFRTSSVYGDEITVTDN